jgi:transposase IS200 family protein
MFEVWAFLRLRAEDFFADALQIFQRSRMFILTARASQMMLYLGHAQAAASLLWRGILALHHHQLLRRLPLLASARNRDLFLRVLESVRRRHHFVVVGYVVMPEHVHLLIGEPQRGDPSLVMKALKQGFARRLLKRLR